MPVLRAWYAAFAFIAIAPMTQLPFASTAATSVDDDRDGLDDALEDELANRFAPVLHHDPAESNYPTSVEHWLQVTRLHEFGTANGLRFDRTVAGTAGEALESIDLSVARRPCKDGGYYLADVPREYRRGSTDTRDWITYVHSFPNQDAGVTLQYWRAYAYDQVRLGPLTWSHGGDWESVAVHLDRSLQPAAISLLGHRDIERRLPADVRWEGTHPMIWSQPGGHASTAVPTKQPRQQFIRQETWQGGQVTWADGRRQRGGGIVNVGERSRPRPGQSFIRYPGLWGEPHRLYSTSGYWGPAFNETGALCEDGQRAYGTSLACGLRQSCRRIVHVAWCGGMDGTRLDLTQECQSAATATR